MTDKAIRERNARQKIMIENLDGICATQAKAIRDLQKQLAAAQSETAALARTIKIVNRESTIQKAADELVHVEEYTYLDGDVELDHIQDWYMN